MTLKWSHVLSVISTGKWLIELVLSIGKCFGYVSLYLINYTESVFTYCVIGKGDRHISPMHGTYPL